MSALTLKVDITGGPPHVIYDLAKGSEGTNLVILATADAKVCAQVQHGENDAQALADGTIALLSAGEIHSGPAPIVVALSAASRGVRRGEVRRAAEAADALRRSLTSGTSPVGGLRIALAAGRPHAVIARPAPVSTNGRRAQACPGLGAYLRGWMGSLPVESRKLPPKVRHPTRREKDKVDYAR